MLKEKENGTYYCSPSTLYNVLSLEDPPRRFKLLFSEMYTVRIQSTATNL